MTGWLIAAVAGALVAVVSWWRRRQLAAQVAAGRARVEELELELESAEGGRAVAVAQADALEDHFRRRHAADVITAEVKHAAMVDDPVERIRAVDVWVRSHASGSGDGSGDGGASGVREP